MVTAVRSSSYCEQSAWALIATGARLVNEGHADAARVALEKERELESKKLSDDE